MGAHSKVLTGQQSEILRRWNQGAFPGAIAAAMEITRHSVVTAIHKARRLKAQSLIENPVRAGSTVHDEPAKPKAPAYERKAPKPLLAPPAPSAAAYSDRQGQIRAPDQRDMPWDEGTAENCKWPAWGFDANKGPICGCQTLTLREGTKRESKSSYCEFHHRKAYPAYGTGSKDSAKF